MGRISDGGAPACLSQDDHSTPQEMLSHARLKKNGYIHTAICGNDEATLRLAIRTEVVAMPLGQRPYDLASDRRRAAADARGVGANRNCWAVARLRRSGGCKDSQSDEGCGGGNELRAT